MPQHTRTRRFALATCLVLWGCAERDQSSAAPAKLPPTHAEAASPTAAAVGDTAAPDITRAGGDNAPLPAQRKLIQTAELHIEVDAYETARRALDKQLAALGGWVENARVEHSDGHVSSAELTLRVPADKLGELVSDAAGFGRVLHESLDTQDVSESYWDMSARLKNAKRLEARLLELLGSSAGNVTQLLEVERELARVREQIERFEGQLQRYDDQVTMSTVKLRLATRQTYAAGTEPTVGERVKVTLGGSWQVMVGAGYALLLVVVALLPWLVPLGFAGWLVRSAVRRRRARRALAAPAPIASASQASTAAA